MNSPIPEFKQVAQFHGHVCPGLAIGYRVSIAALDWLGEQRAADEQIVAVAENRSCAVDALQCVLGTTLGKGNLIILDWGKQGYTVFRRPDGAGMRFFFQLPPHLASLPREELIPAILGAPQDEIIRVAPAQQAIPDRARVEPSVPCAICGEPTMQSALIRIDGALVCHGCAPSGDAAV